MATKGSKGRWLTAGLLAPSSIWFLIMLVMPLVSSLETPERFTLERVLSVDTTAAGGNAALLAEATQVAAAVG